MFEDQHLANAVREGARVDAALPMTTAAERTASDETITTPVVSSVSLRPTDRCWVTVSETVVGVALVVAVGSGVAVLQLRQAAQAEARPTTVSVLVASGSFPEGHRLSAGDACPNLR